MYIRLLKIVGVLLAMLTGMTLFACSKGDAPRPDDVAAVRALMEQRAQAIANKDIEAFRQLIHDEYNDGRNSKDDIVMYMEEVFAKYDKISLDYQKAPVELKMNTARVVQRLVYDINDGENKVHDHEHLILRKSNGVWQMFGGIKIGLF